jgi:hypothetical protein
MISPSLIVNPTPSTVYINGNATQFEAYLINGNNYFKLRDLSYAISNTEKHFDVIWDNTTKKITLISGQAYTPIGQEMAKGNGSAKKATLNSNINIFQDNTPVRLSAYLIDGNNFVKLRDVMRLFNIGVTYDKATRDIRIDTTIPYVDIMTNLIGNITQT